MNDVIFNCPFCGSDELFVGRGIADREGVPAHIYCDHCGCQGPWAYVKESQLENKIVIANLTQWNQRPDYSIG
jgi:transcription elongation factor Elf1